MGVKIRLGYVSMIISHVHDNAYQIIFNFIGGLANYFLHCPNCHTDFYRIFTTHSELIENRTLIQECDSYMAQSGAIANSFTLAGQVKSRVLLCVWKKTHIRLMLILLIFILQFYLYSFVYYIFQRLRL